MLSLDDKGLVIGGVLILVKSHGKGMFKVCYGSYNGLWYAVSKCALLGDEIDLPFYIQDESQGVLDPQELILHHLRLVYGFLKRNGIESNYIIFLAKELKRIGYSSFQDKHVKNYDLSVKKTYLELAERIKHQNYMYEQMDEIDLPDKSNASDFKNDYIVYTSDDDVFDEPEIDSPLNDNLENSARASDYIQDDNSLYDEENLDMNEFSEFGYNSNSDYRDFEGSIEL